MNSFHSKCDNQGATVTIIRSVNGYLYGGYTSISWTSRGTYAPDNTAFLFTLTNPNGIPPTKYPISPGKNAIYDMPSYGPTFGTGHDLYMDSNNTNGYTNFPHAFQDSTGHGNNTFTGNRNTQAADIEVFKCI
jgi:hypothetical protein